jgi:hypothetical protein
LKPVDLAAPYDRKNVAANGKFPAWETKQRQTFSAISASLRTLILDEHETGGPVDGVPLQMRLLVVVEIEPGKSRRLDAFTVAVNAHGGLLETSTRLAKGQKLLLSNPAIGLEEKATVVNVLWTDEASFEVAFEFDKTTAHFWPLSFPPLQGVL